jgi:hypothetical protein
MDKTIDEIGLFFTVAVYVISTIYLIYKFCKTRTKLNQNVPKQVKEDGGKPAPDISWELYG